MASAKFITYERGQIALLDFANCDVEQMLHVIEEGSKLIRSQPLKSVLVLSDFTGASSDPRLLAAMRAFAAGNEPFVRASAIVGLSRVAQIFYEIIMKFTGRYIPIFADAQFAKDWLIAQPIQGHSFTSSDVKIKETISEEAQNEIQR